MTRLFQKRMLKAQLENRAAVASVNNHVPETIRNIRMIHVLQRESLHGTAL
jgi:ATP-binding cassette subfamily B multidrug efflux pump